MEEKASETESQASFRGWGESIWLAHHALAQSHHYSADNAEDRNGHMRRSLQRSRRDVQSSQLRERQPMRSVDSFLALKN